MPIVRASVFEGFSTPFTGEHLRLLLHLFSFSENYNAYLELLGSLMIILWADTLMGEYSIANPYSIHTM